MPSGALPSQHDQTIADCRLWNLLRCRHGVATNSSLISERIGGCRCLATCDGRMDWPRRGVHFFFEARELGSDPGRGLPAVWIDTNALKPASRTSSWSRLLQHRGNTRSATGNHRRSTFRLIVGVLRSPSHAMAVRAKTANPVEIEGRGAGPARSGDGPPASAYCRCASWCRFAGDPPCRCTGAVAWQAT